MESRVLKSDALLLLTAAIWGFAFVAQRVGMEYVGPFTFNGFRFTLGCLVLLPLILRKRSLAVSTAGPGREENPDRSVRRPLLIGGALAGLAVFCGATFQQMGLVHTTAGKAGFITGLYVIFVPILGLFWQKNPGMGTWLGAVVAAAGLYLLSVRDGFSLEFGDLLELIGAFFWAIHLLILGWFSPRVDSLKLAFSQFAVCAVLSMIAALILEPIVLSGLYSAAIPILYGGLFSVGLAYTLQVVAQRHAHPAHAAILLSLEAVFAAMGGWMILGELLSGRELIGCGLMLLGIVSSHLRWGGVKRVNSVRS